MEENTTTAPQETAQEPSFQIFDSQEGLAQSLSTESPEPVQEDVQPEVQQVEEPVVETQQVEESVEMSSNNEELSSAPSEQYNEDQIESAVVQFVSERLNIPLDSIDDLNKYTQNKTDERIDAISRFVQETGRSPEDWFRYQTLNPSEMDDATSVRVQMSAEYPNLSSEEINTFLKNKYKLDPDVYDEEEVKLATLNLKIDAQKARQSIDEIRQEYSAPVQQQTAQPESFIDQQWVSNMTDEVAGIEGFEFDLGNGNSFNFGLNDEYKKQLVSKASNLDKFFENYVNQDGSWDYELLSAHQTVIDNIDTIVKTAYQQGIGDGQKNIVERTSNASADSPQQTTQTQADPWIEQVKRAKFGDDKITFL